MDHNLHSTEVREAYIRIQEILSSEIETNGFINEHEAISFLSSIFSHIMSYQFLGELLEVSQQAYTQNNPYLLGDHLKDMLSEVRVRSLSDSEDLGVSMKFINSFYKGRYNTTSDIFISYLKKEEPRSSGSYLKYRRFVLNSFYLFLSNTIKDSKGTGYRERRTIDILKIMMSFFLLITFFMFVFYSELNFVGWLKEAIRL